MAESGDFVHLHVHSHYSLMDGAATVEALVEGALERGQRALALTDHGNLYGAVEFYDHARKKGLHPILGMEAYMAARNRRERSDKNGNETSHLTLLAADEEGWANLLSLSSEGFLTGMSRRPRLDLELLAAHHRGLIALSGCLSGVLNTRLLRQDYAEAKQLAGNLREIFGPDGFYLEVMRIGLARQEECNEALLRLARELSLPVVVTNDVHYLAADDWMAQDVLLAIHTGERLKNENRFRMETHENFLRTGAEMAALFPDLPQGLRAAAEIADRCRVALPKGVYHLPRFETGTAESPEELFRRLCREGLRERYGDPPAARVRERLETEMGVILKMGFASYFLITWDYIRHARSIGVPVGPGRGSAAGSIVAYVLRITDVDPLRYNLLFERFLNADRISMPDIDVDICREGRQRIIDYVRNRYGQESVSQIITFSTMGARRAIRDVGRVLDLPLAEVDAICKKLPGGPATLSLADLLGQSEELREIQARSPIHRQLLEYARRIDGLARDPSTHAAGVVIADGPLVRYAPLCNPQGDVVTQWQMAQVERMGLLKMDILGLKNLTILDKAVKLVRETRGIAVDMDRLPLDDRETYALLGRADTSGIFQLESDGMRELILRLQPDKFEDIIALNALYRPGPLGSGMVDSYVATKRGEKPAAIPHPDLEEILGETYGNIVYQEQVMLIAVRVGGLTLNDADALRKAMGKKDEKIMAAYADKFVAGAKAKGHDERFATDLFANMAKFASYGFNKSHATAYALLAFRTAYMKAHFPLEFLCSLMTCDLGDTDKLMLFVRDAEERGIEVRPPDIDRSGVEFAVEGQAIRYALAAVKGVGAAAAQAIVDARGRLGGAFRSLHQFAEEVDLSCCNRATLEALIKAGAMDAIARSRAGAMARLEGVLRAGMALQADRRRGQGHLFGEPGPEDDADPDPTEAGEGVPEWPEAERLQREKEALGFFLTGHPFQRKGPLLRRLAGRSIAEATAPPEGGEPRPPATPRPAVLAGFVSCLKVTVVKQGQSAGMKMARFRLDDLTGSVQAVAFPRTWAEVSSRITDGASLFLTGQVRHRDGPEGWEMVVDDAATVAAFLARNVRGLTLQVDAAFLDRKGGLERLAGLLAQHRGSQPLHLRVVEGDRATLLRAGAESGVAPSEDLLEELAGLLGPEGIEFHRLPRLNTPSPRSSFPGPRGRREREAEGGV